MQELLTLKQIRLKNYDCSLNGYYFITVCSNDRKNIFGEYVENPVGTALAAVRYKNNIKLSKLGQIIENQWINMIISNWINTSTKIIQIYPDKFGRDHFMTTLSETNVR